MIENQVLVRQGIRRRVFEYGLMSFGALKPVLRYETQECDLWKNHPNPNRRGISEDCTFI